MENLINFYDGCLVGDELWFSNLNFNALMKMNIKTGKTEFVDTFPYLADTQEFAHIRTIRYDDCLYFISYRNRVIHIWNLMELKWEKTVHINCSEIENAFLYNNEIWLFPASLKNPIVKFNLKDRKEIVLNELTEQINAINSKCISILSETVSLCIDKLIIASYEGNTVITIDCKTEQITNKYSFDDISISGIKVKDKKHFWVWFTNSADIYLVSETEGNIDRINTEINFQRNRTPFSNMINIDEHRALVLPRHTEEILLIDTLINETNKLKIPNEFKRCKVTSLLLFYKQVDGFTFLFPCGGNNLLIVNANTMSISHISFIVDDEFLEYAKKMKRKIFNSMIYSGDLSEGKGWTEMLPNFLDKVCEGSKAVTKCDNKHIGTDIFIEIKNIL